MSIQHALLTSLLERPSTGYELAGRFDRSIGYFWQASHQQIYRELGRMAKAGWVVAEADAVVGKRRSKTYQVLPAGRDELVRWVREDDFSGHGNQSLLVKLRAEAVLGPLGVEQALLRLVSEHQERLQVYRDIERRDFSTDGLSSAQQLQHAVLRLGIMTEESWLAWADEVLPILERARH